MTQGDSSQKEPRLISYILLSITIILAALNLSYLWIQSSNPNETSNPESLFIFNSIQLSNSKPLYTDFRDFPFNVTQYTPVQYGILAGIRNIFSLDVQSLFKTGRLFVLFCTIVIGCLIFRNGISKTGNLFPSAIAATLFLGCYILWPFACSNRPDVLAILFSVAGLILFSENQKGRFYISILLLVLSFYTKQSFISVAGAIILYLLLSKQYRTAIQFAAIYGIAVGSIWLLLHQISAGMSTLNLTEANIAPIKLQNIRLVTAAALQSTALAFILSLSGLTRDSWRSLPGMYFLVSLLWAVFTSAKTGSNQNYFIEPLAAGCLLIPTGLQRAIQTRGVPQMLLVGLFLILSLPQINFTAHTLRTIRFANEELAQKLASEAKGLVISDNPRIALASRQPFFMDPYVYSYLEIKGRWNSTKLLSLMQDARVQYLILKNPLDQPMTWQGVIRLPNSVIQTASTHYTLSNRIDGYYVYAHK